MAAREMFRLDKPDTGGVSLRATLEQAYKSTGVRPAALDTAVVPFCANHIMEWFWELNAARGSNGFGALPLGFGDIASWASLTGRLLRPLEVRLLRVVDREFLSVMNKVEA